MFCSNINTRPRGRDVSARPPERYRDATRIREGPDCGWHGGRKHHQCCEPRHGAKDLDMQRTADVHHVVIHNPGPWGTLQSSQSASDRR